MDDLIGPSMRREPLYKHSGINALTSGISWGDVPTWIAALQKGSIRDTDYRHVHHSQRPTEQAIDLQFDDLIIIARLNPLAGPQEKDLYLSIANRSWSSFPHIKILGRVTVELCNGERVVVGFK